MNRKVFKIGKSSFGWRGPCLGVVGIITEMTIGAFRVNTRFSSSRFFKKVRSVVFK